LDVFYYWKKFDENIKDGMVGRFVSTTDNLEKLKAHSPDFIWAFKIPKGYGGRRGKGEGQLKLLARLKWSDSPLPGLKPTEEENSNSMIYYNHKHADSILYEDTGSDEAMAHVTGLLNPKYFSAFRANFNGQNGVQILELPFAAKFGKAVAHYSSSQFLTGIAKLK
jgi:hypothetical protein